VSLDSHVGTDGSSSGGSASLDTSHHDGDRDFVFVGSLHVGLMSLGSLEASGHAPLDGSSVGLSPFDVHLTSVDSDLESRVVVRPALSKGLLGASHGTCGKFPGLDGLGVCVRGMETGLVCGSVGVSCDFPCSEGGASLDLHSELVCECGDMEGLHGGMEGFGLVHFGVEDHGPLVPRSSNISGVEVCTNLDSSVSG